MKKTFTLSLFCFITSIVISQSLPDLPLNDDMIFFEFSRTTPKDSKKCLWNYVIANPFHRSVKQYCDSLEIAKYTKLLKGKKGVLRISVSDKTNPLINGHSNNCGDTAIYNLRVNFPGHKDVKTNGQLLIREIKQLAGVKEEGANGFSCQMYVYFSDKKSTKIVFKGFQYLSIYMQEGKGSNENIPLEEIYFSLQEKETVNNQQVEFFQNIEIIVKSIERLFTKDLNYAVKTSDL
jgi:hypothetical protein